jgi:hypothetical protein
MATIIADKPAVAENTLGRPVTKNEYINDFLYFVVRPDNRAGKDVLICCSGVNLDRFSPITKGRYGIGGNPVKGGLQVVNYDICSLATSKGATPRVILGNDSAGIAPTKDLWYSEIIQIENAPVPLADEIVRFGVETLVQKVVSCSRLDYEAPDKLPEPGELQVFLDKLCNEMPFSEWKG